MFAATPAELGLVLALLGQSAPATREPGARVETSPAPADDAAPRNARAYTGETSVSSPVQPSVASDPSSKPSSRAQGEAAGAVPDATPKKRKTGEKTYEWERMQAVLDEQGLKVDHAPEGKRVAWVKIDREQVFRKGELFPVGLNKLHVLTREYVIRRELLIEKGETYTDTFVEESMRNLRGMGLFSLVRIVPIQTENPDEVGVLVHTRDLWSLRLEQSFNITSQLNSLNIAIVERNVAGVGHVARIPFALRPDVFTLGESYSTRRTFGRPIAIGQSGGLIFNRGTGRPEGGYVSGSVGRPFYNLAQRFSFSLSGSYDSRIRRQLANGDPEPWIPDGEEVEGAEGAEDEDANAAGLRIWREQFISGRVGVAFREGVKLRTTISVFFYATDRQTSLVEESGVDPARALEFLDQVPPKARREVGPGISLNIFKPKFVVFQNLDTFGQSENVRVGPSLGGTINAPIKALGSSYESLVTSAGAGYTWAPKGALIRVSVGPRARWQEGEWIDGRFEGRVRVASPMLGPVRLVGRVKLTARWNDTTNAQESLGANNGLRGFPSQHLIDFGVNSLLFNVELRTKPLVWRAIHLGGVLFYDAGTVFKNIYQAKISHGFGIGIRLLLPQINRNPWVLDGGFSVDPFRFVPTITGGQVVPMR